MLGNYRENFQIAWVPQNSQKQLKIAQNWVKRDHGENCNPKIVVTSWCISIWGNYEQNIQVPWVATDFQGGFQLGSSSTKELSVSMDLNCISENLFEPQNVCIPQFQYPWKLQRRPLKCIPSNSITIHVLTNFFRP